ncbi:MAG: C4-dicarboxylate ABC transporter, partial [Pseudomonadota bacterium]
AAVKTGIVMFVLPFVFAMYPAILLIEAAIIDPKSATGDKITYFAGYANPIEWQEFPWLLLRLLVPRYLLTSAPAYFNQWKLPLWDRGLRLCLA